MCPEPHPVPVQPSAPKLLDQLRGRLRVKHYSIRTEQSYVDWLRRFVPFHNIPVASHGAFDPKRFKRADNQKSQSGRRMRSNLLSTYRWHRLRDSIIL